MIKMDKKILTAFQRLYGAINAFYEDHDLTLGEKEKLDAKLNSLEKEMLEIDKAYDRRRKVQVYA